MTKIFNRRSAVAGADSKIRNDGVAALADEILPGYPLDGGPLTRKQRAAIRQVAGRLGQGELKSSLFGETK